MFPQFFFIQRFFKPKLLKRKFRTEERQELQFQEFKDAKISKIQENLKYSKIFKSGTALEKFYIILKNFNIFKSCVVFRDFQSNFMQYFREKLHFNQFATPLTSSTFLTLTLD